MKVTQVKSYDIEIKGNVINLTESEVKELKKELDSALIYEYQISSNMGSVYPTWNNPYRDFGQADRITLTDSSLGISNPDYILTTMGDYHK